MTKKDTKLESKSYLKYQNEELTFGIRPQKVSSFLLNYQKPIYLYDLNIIAERCGLMKSHLKNVKFFFAMKANAHEKVLKQIHAQGFGADVVSGGEVKRALEVGFSPEQIIFSGVGKTEKEILFAIEKNIYQINVESHPELERIISLCQKTKRRMNIVLRVNPNVSIKTHPYIATGLKENKFGIDYQQLDECLKLIKDHQNEVNFRGISLHLGSQMTDLEGFKEALVIQKELFANIKKDFPEISVFDFGGGLGIYYEESSLEKEEALLKQYAEILHSELSDRNCELQSEPGRWIVARSGILICEVQYIKKTKHKTFAVVDSGMNHLIRPTLYQAYHRILGLKKRTDSEQTYDVVGPICESSDFFGKDRKLPTDLKQGDYVVVADVGAYGMSMANTYNLQDLPEEKFI